MTPAVTSVRGRPDGFGTIRSRNGYETVHRWRSYNRLTTIDVSLRSRLIWKPGADNAGAHN